MVIAKHIARVLICLLTLVAIAKAQGTGATIQGSVTDPNRAVIPEASVTVTNTETNIQRTAITGAAGIYVIPNLPPGRYRVQVVLPGFKISVHENIDLVVGPATPLQSRDSAPATTSSCGTGSNIREAATPRVRLRAALAGSCLESMRYASSTSSPVSIPLKPVIVSAVK